jgi:superfamily I DNA/RNA helicase
VLGPTNWVVQQAVTGLSAAGLRVQPLDRYDGRPNDLVKVGTYHRAKGLEFKAVFLPGLTRGQFPRRPAEGEGTEEAAEARELAISQLFVAMTRARDVLVVHYDREPADVLDGAPGSFDMMGMVVP